MSDRPKSGLLGSSLIYLTAGAIDKILPFLLLPILTRFLSTAEYGALALFQSMLFFATPIIGMNMSMMLMKEFFKRNKAEMARLNFNVLMVLSASTAFTILLAFLLNIVSPTVFELSAKWMYLIPAMAFLMTVFQCNLILLMCEKRPYLYGGFEIAYTVLQVVFTLLYVCLFKWSWEGRVAAGFTAAVLIGIFSLLYMARSGYLAWGPSKAEMSNILKVCFPLIFYSLGILVIDVSDRFFINSMVGKDALGVYSVGYIFGMAILLFRDAFVRVWNPWLHEQIENITEARKIIVVRRTYLVNFGFAALAVSLTAILVWLVDFMTDPDYYQAKEYILWVSLANGVTGMYGAVAPYLVNLGKTAAMAKIAALAAVINLIGNYVLIGMNGPLGAAQATLLAFGASYLMTWWYANRIFPMPWFSAKLFIKSPGKE